MSRPPQTLLQRFWRRVEVQPDGCWVWLGGLNQYGYGQFSTGHRAGRLAHRFAFEEFIGPIPEGEQVDHLCRNRACVNPNHMETVTLRENLRRGLPNNQHRKASHCRAGHEYTPENTEMTDGGIRRCRTCRAEYKRRAAESVKAKRRADPGYGRPAYRAARAKRQGELPW